MSENHNAEEGATKDKALAADITSSYVLKLSLFGLGIILMTFLIVRQRRNAYEMVKQDEKSTA